ncbi:DUF58 domain-containing protein [bacterium]|nr:DUF58 domain-containing protein [bacterium]
MVSRRVKQFALLFLSVYALILTFVIKLPHIIFITSFLWSIVISSIILSYYSLRKTKVSFQLPSEMTQGEEGFITYTIGSSWVLLPGLTVYADLPSPLVRIAPASFSPNEWTGQERFFALRRGVYRISELSIGGLDFLGVFQLNKKVKVDGEIIVYPFYVRLSPLLFSGGTGEEGMGGSQLSRGGVEFAGVREWEQGEDIRDVHWRLTAKWRKFFVVLHSQAGSKSQIIVIDCSPKGVFGSYVDNSFELALKIACSLAWTTISNGGELNLVYSNEEGKIIHSRHTEFATVQEELTRLEAVSPLTLSSLLEQFSLPKDFPLTILTSLPDLSLLPFLEEQSGQGNVPFVILIDGASFGKSGWLASQFVEAASRFAIVNVIGKGENLKERLEKIWGMRYFI